MCIDYYIFYRESNDWDDILKDPGIRKKIMHVIKWHHHLMIGFKQEDQNIGSYIAIKWCEELRSWNDIVPDRTPILGRDYAPRRSLW